MNIRITLPLLLLGFSALAVSTPAAAAAPPAEAATTNNEARHWFAFRPARDDFQETILDCSRWVEAPTGRQTIRGDVGVIFSDAQGRINVSRMCWSNPNSNLVSDLPLEAWLYPATWGELTFH